MITYEVQFDDDVVRFGLNKNAAVRLARLTSAKRRDVAYVVAVDGEGPVGHIVYTNGFRCSIEGRV